MGLIALRFPRRWKSVSVEVANQRRELNRMSAKLTNEILTAAIDGFEAQKSRMDAKIAELRAMLSGGPAEPAAAPPAPKRKKRRLSAAGRRAIVEATKRRWAAIRAEKEKASQAVAPKKTARKKAAAKKAR